MLGDYMDGRWWPHIMYWLDWNISTYRVSWFVCVFVMYLRAYSPYSQDFPFDVTGLVFVFFTGTCLWIAYCAFWYGWGVG
mgnify:CR=1 FL=1